LKPFEQFLEEANKKHDNFYDYSKSIYINSTTKINIICPIHGDFTQIPNSHISGQGCPKCGHYKNTNKKNTEDFIKRSTIIHNNKYDYSKVEYDGNKKKVIIICPTHGEFIQIPNAHLRGAGCWNCSVDYRMNEKRSNSKDFIEKANIAHQNKYDYSLVNYYNNYQKIPIKCPKHGIFNQNPGNHLQGAGCPKCSSIESKSETKIKSILEETGIDFIQQDRTLINPFEIDFVIPDYKIGIEFNGIYYHSEDNGGKNKKYHLNKTDRCEKEGYQLIHIFENEYIQKYNLLRFKIKSLLNKNKYRIFARKCIVREITPQEKCRFNKKYHIQGDSQSCVNLGLFYKERLVQVMTFSKRRKALGSKHVKGEYELSRMSSMKGFTIVGGASKLLKHFEKHYNPKKLISYADRRWSKGDVYYKMGFSFIRNTPPNYWYFYKKRADKPLHHRYKFAKHTLEKQLEIFDPNLTEWENMKNNHYDRIWDSGNMLFEKVYD
jgi:G:T-mismatch repair DNA endonuclease (very short patch repair protein)